MKLTFATLNQEISSLELEVLRRGGAGVRRLDSMRRPERVDFLGRSPGYHYLRAKGNSIEGGTSEVLRNIIAERVLGLPGRAPRRQGRPVEGPAPMSRRRAALLYTDDEEELRTTVREAARRPLALAGRARAHRGRRRTTASVWRGLVRDRRRRPGRAGGPRRRRRLVARGRRRAEELGRAVAPTPFLGSTVLATAALLGVHAVGETDVAGTLGELAAGTRTAALAVPSRPRPSERPFGAVTVAGDGTLSGTVTSVADAATAGILVVPAAGDAGPGLYLGRGRGRPRRRRSSPWTSPGGSRTSRWTAPRRGRSPPASRPRPRCAGALVTGAARRSRPSSSASPSGAWSSPSSTCARGTSSAARSARSRGSSTASRTSGSRSPRPGPPRGTPPTGSRSGTRDAAVAAAVAQAHGSPVAVRAAEECVQMHGGLGFTWEHPAHLYLKRARSDALALGTADRHRSHLGELVDLPPG